MEENESSAEGGRREAWEEGVSLLCTRSPPCQLIACTGGIRGEVIATLATDIPSSKGHKKDADLPKAAYSIHLLRVDSLDDDWPERKERERRWVSLEDAKDLVAWREEMRDGGLAAFPDEARIRELIAQSRP